MKPTPPRSLFIRAFRCAALAGILALCPRLHGDDDLTALGDEFSTAEGLATWQRVIDTEGWGNDVLAVRSANGARPGWLRLVPNSSTWYQEWRGELMFKLVSGDFVATTEIEPRNRAGTGAPEALFSLGGIMVRAPRAMTSPAEWTPGGQNYVFLSLGTGTAPGTYQFEVKTTQNSESVLSVEPGADRAELQVARIGPHLILLRRSAGGEWVVHRRYFRPDFPAMLQAGLTVYTDWNPCEAAGHAWHNTHVLTNGAALPGGGQLAGAFPDLRADFNYFRLARPLVPAALASADLSNPAAVSDSALLAFLGDNASTPPPAGAAPAIVTQPQSTAVQVGAAAELGIAAEGNGPISYQWWKGTDPLPGETGTTLVRPNVQPADAGDYRVVVANSWGSTTSEVATLTVLPAAPAAPLDTNTAVLTVSTTVVASAPERFGFNLQVPELNNYTIDPGFEPTVLRHQFVATGGGADYIENNAGPTTSHYQTLTNGFFDGAAVRVYRPLPEGPVQLVREARVAHYAVDENRVYLDGPGPAVQAGDYYFLKLLSTEPPRDRVDPRMTFARYNDTWRSVGGSEWPYGLPVAVERDATTMAPEDGGHASLRLQAPGAHEVTIRQARFSSPSSYGGYYPQLVAGRHYRIDVWLRQSGIPDGTARVFLTQHYQSVSNRFDVGADWGKHSFPFTAPATPAGTEAISELCLGFTGPGTLWADNLLLYEDDDLDPATSPAFSVRPEALQAMFAYAPGPVRLWAGQANLAWGTSLESLTGPEVLQQNGWQADQGKTGPENAYTLPTALPLVQALGGTPWIIVSPSFCEPEWRGLIEYLAAPYDPAVDSPESKPWAARRHAQGRTAPWIDAFPRLRIEFGNECWNSFFQFGYPGGGLAGQFAEYFFRVAQASPWWSNLSDKTDFIVNGWVLQAGPEGYGHAAAARSPLARYSDLTGYLGGWELGSNFGTTVTDVAFQDMLLFPASWLRHFVDRHVATRDAVIATGRDYRLAVYEGGPGYPLPGPGHEFNSVAEAYGKSLAAGTATLDTFLYNSLRRIDPQAYFTFGAGPNWFSHTNTGAAWRPHPAWLALQMRNQFARGDMVHVALNRSPVTDIPASNLADNPVPAQPDTPLVAGYAFQDGGRYTVFVLSRRLDLATPVILRLPFTSAASAVRHALTGDPRANNVTGENLGITTSALGAAGSALEFEMPPASVYAFVFEDAVAPSESGPAVVVSRAPGQESPTTDPVARFAVHFSEAVIGLDASDFQVGGATGASSAQLSEAFPWLGTDYEVLVSGLATAGVVTLSLPAGVVTAASAGGAGNLAPVYFDASVEYAPPPVQERLLAFDDFGADPSVAPEPPFLNGVATGAGWSSPWQVQNFGPGYAGGFRLADVSPLAFGPLATTGNHAIGGRLYETASRPLAVESAFDGFAVPGRVPAAVGRDGRTLWFSVLIRKDTAQFGNDGPFVNLVDDAFAWNFGAARLAIGYFGGASIEGGIPRWTLAVPNAAGTDFEYLRTPAPVVPGEAALVVVRIQFGAEDRIDVFVNPDRLGGAAPAQPDSTWVATGPSPNLAFRTVGFYGGPSVAPGVVEGSIDELRFGTTYATVTPVTGKSWEAWRGGYTWPDVALSGPGDDADGDGATNLEEYATGTDPLVPGEPWYPVLTEVDGTLRVSFPLDARSIDATCVVEVSNDLESWQDGARYQPTGTSIARDASTLTTAVSLTGAGPVKTITESVGLAGAGPAWAFVRLRFE